MVSRSLSRTGLPWADVDAAADDGDGNAACHHDKRNEVPRSAGALSW